MEKIIGYLYINSDNQVFPVNMQEKTQKKYMEQSIKAMEIMDSAKVRFTVKKKINHDTRLNEGHKA